MSKFCIDTIDSIAIRAMGGVGNHTLEFINDIEEACNSIVKAFELYGDDKKSEIEVELI